MLSRLALHRGAGNKWYKHAGGGSAPNSGGSFTTSGMVLYLDANNPSSYTSGNVWYDLSGAGNNGSFSTAPTLTSVSNRYFEFDGTNDYVTLPNTSLDIRTQMTVSAWVQWNTFDLNMIYGIGYDNATSQEQFQLRTYNGNLETGTFGGGLTSIVQASLSGNNIVTNQWYMITSVFTSSYDFELYVNDQMVGSLSRGIILNDSGNPPVIGATITGGNYGRYFNGNIGEVYVYNRDLSSAEVQDNFNATRLTYGV